MEFRQPAKQVLTGRWIRGRDYKSMIKYPHVKEWVDRMAAMCQPDQIHWCDGSEAEWAALTERLACAPPAFILVEWRYVPLITGAAPRAASLAAWLAARYRVAFTTERGTWYERVR